jgi:hypothetical protein
VRGAGGAAPGHAQLDEQPGGAAGMTSIDTTECLRRGAIGAFGAIPGTLAAHPFDVLKMKMQARAGVVCVDGRVRVVHNFLNGVHTHPSTGVGDGSLNCHP